MFKRLREKFRWWKLIRANKGIYDYDFDISRIVYHNGKMWLI